MSNILEKKTYFLHIPKTGGNWVRSIIRDSGINEVKTNRISKHATYDLLAGANSNKYFNRVSRHKINFFCVVRHPLLWYQSWFNYQNTKGWSDWGEKANFNCWHCLSPLNMPKQNDFNQFMNHVNDNVPGFLTSLYHSYVLNSGARFLQNENLSDELLSLNREWRLGLNEKSILDSEKINVSFKSNIIWDEKVVEATLENEAALLKKYGYENNHYNLVKIK